MMFLYLSFYFFCPSLALSLLSSFVAKSPVTSSDCLYPWTLTVFFCPRSPPSPSFLCLATDVLASTQNVSRFDTYPGARTLRKTARFRERRYECLRVSVPSIHKLDKNRFRGSSKIGFPQKFCPRKSLRHQEEDLRRRYSPRARSIRSKRQRRKIGISSTESCNVLHFRRAKCCRKSCNGESTLG